MQLLEHPQPKASETSAIQNQVTTLPRLSMIWVTQSEQGRQRLVAKWVVQN